jgi:hypothetical protein
MEQEQNRREAESVTCGERTWGVEDASGWDRLGFMYGADRNGWFVFPDR